MTPWEPFLPRRLSAPVVLIKIRAAAKMKTKKQLPSKHN
nr:MAG TPA: hypothetical protein [Caudoviricetes sp.]